MKKEKEKIHKPSLLNNDIFLRISSIAVAVIVWFTLSITVYSEIKETVENVVVTIDTSNLEEYNLEPINFGEQTVQVEVYGPRYEIASLTADDLIAQLTPYDISLSGYREIDVEIIPKDASLSDLTFEVTPSSFNVYFDTYVEKTIEVIPEIPNISVAEGYIMTDPETHPETITIRGPEHQIERIDKVVARVNNSETLSEAKNYTSPELIYYDGNIPLGSEGWTITPQEVAVSVEALKMKTVPLSFQIQNAPPNFDQSVLEFTSSADEIQIAGPTNIIDDIAELNIGYVDLRNLENGDVFEFDINLPDDVENISELETVTVTVVNENLATKELDLSEDNVTVLGLDGIGFDYEVDSAHINRTITITGDADLIEEITSADVVVEIDVQSGLLPTVLLSAATKVYLPSYDTVWVNETFTVTVDIFEIEE